VLVRVPLDAEQCLAAMPRTGPVRVVAGAGTGKTAVIAARFRELLAAGVRPGEILVMTFTERAAAAMRERIQAVTGLSDIPSVSTFHAIALRWLREEARRVGLSPGFRILAPPDRWIVLRELMWELAEPALVGQERPDEIVAPMLKLLERIKQELVPLPRFQGWAERLQDPQRRELMTAVARLLRAFGARCRHQGLLDFDDLLLEVVRLFEQEPAVRDDYASRYPWIMVDEYQDTNLAQERLVELMGAPTGNVCVVGDDDQSIYRFRGASRAGMDRFLEHFPDAVTVTLGRNRRSTGAIVAAARQLIEHNSARLPKPLVADPAREAGWPPEVWRFATGEQEAAAIASEVARVVAKGTAPSRIGVLVRTHAVARPIAAALAAAGVPYRHLAGPGLLRRPEVRDLIAYLRLLDDPLDLRPLARLLSRPPLALDLARALTTIREGQAQGLTPLEALAGWPPTRAWAEHVQQLTRLPARLGVEDLLFELLERTRYLEVAVVDPLQRRRAGANLSRFTEMASDYCEDRRDHSLGPFIRYLDLILLSGLDLDEAELEEDEDAVQLMTIHQAKGLEFDLVFIPAMVEGRLPQSGRRAALGPLAGDDLPPHLLDQALRGREDQVAEERRLCYVALTRGRERVVLSWADHYEGVRHWRPSRFLAELGRGLEERDRRDKLAPAQAVGPLAAAAAGEPPVLSFSSIATYRECPRQHWYRYQLRLPAPQSLEAQFGSIVHLALMRAGRELARGKVVDLACLQHLYWDAWREATVVDRRRPVFEALGWRLLRRLHDDGGLGRPLLVEHPFTVELGGWTLRGVIDRVDRVDRGWRIVDYKSGNPIPASRLRRDLQLALYALGASSLGLQPLELEIVYLRDGHRVRLDADQELLTEAERIGAEVAAGVAAGRFEARPERRRCALCPYRLVCDQAW
jgi:DNA helicase-2/ATP-dependent DNA helicase PcrA